MSDKNQYGIKRTFGHVISWVFKHIYTYAAIISACTINGIQSVNMETLGYASAILIGLSLGLIGSGGSILTVHVLVYLMGLNPVKFCRLFPVYRGHYQLGGQLFFLPEGTNSDRYSHYFRVAFSGCSIYYL
jgi:hypothetical protein